jgi:CheY-like chemotaxis protein
VTAPHAPAARVDVLIAEDDAVLRQSLRSLLERQGLHVAEAPDGTAALDLAQHSPPRCVLLDLTLPGLDGYAVARRLRADPHTRALHIHCLSGQPGRAAREQARQAGFELYLTKPVGLDALLAAVGPQAGPGEAGGVSNLTFAEAEELLDLLQRQNCSGLEVTLEEDEGGVTVRCLCPPGLRLVRDEGGAVRLIQV